MEEVTLKEEEEDMTNIIIGQDYMGMGKVRGATIHWLLPCDGVTKQSAE